MKRTIGGNRLGNGPARGMSVSMHSYERSNHDLGYVARTSMSAGPIVPISKFIGLPGDTFDIDTTAMIRTLPTQNALFGSFNWRLDWFVCPIRLYIGGLHNNTLGVAQNMDKVELPKLVLTAAPNTQLGVNSIDVDTQQIAPDSLNRYLGIAGVGYNPTNTTLNRQFNGLYHLAYYDICKNAYINTQEDMAYVISGSGVDTRNVTGMNTNEIPIKENQPFTVALTFATKILFTELKDFEPENVHFEFSIIKGGPIYKVDLRLENSYNATIEMPDGVRIEFSGEHATDHFFVQVKVSSGTTQQFYWNNVESWYATGKWPTGLAGITSFPIENLDKARSQILKMAEIGEYVSITKTIANSNSNINYMPYLSNVAYDDDTKSLECRKSQVGLMLRTYMNDLFNNFVKTEWIENINQTSSVQVVDGSFSINSLIISRKVFNYKNRNAIGGGTLQDWQEVTYSVDAQSFCEAPVYMGGMTADVVFDEVVSTAGTADEALGTLAGRGNLSNIRGGSVVIKIKEPSVVIGMMSIVPRVDYSQGNDWDMFQLKTMEDLHKPEFDGIGFQDLPTELMAWWDCQLTLGDGPLAVEKRFSMGKQPAWIQYMTNVNKVYGDFARKNNAEGMVITRNYQSKAATLGISSIADATTYVQPQNYNYLFTSSAIEDQPFWVQVKFDIKARRKMSSAVMPNL